MPYKPRDDQTLGVHIENGTLLAAFVVSEKGTCRVKRLFELPINTQDDLVKPLYNDAKGKALKHSLDNHLVVSGLHGTDVLVRRLRLKLTDEEDIAAAYSFQAEPHLPYPIESAVLDKSIVESGDGGSLVVFLASKKEAIQNHLSALQKIEIDPEIISAEPIALADLFHYASSERNLGFIVYIGRTSSVCVMAKEGKILASHELEKGWLPLYDAFLLDRSSNPPPISELFSVDLEAEDPSDLSHFIKAMDELQKLVLWNYMALSRETKIKEAPLLYVTGEGANIPHLASRFAAGMELELGELKPPGDSCSLADLNRFAIPIGLALSAQTSSPLTINFRRQELKFASPWKRFLKSLYVYGALATLLALSLYLFGLSYLSYREDELRARFLSLLSLSQKPYEQFEKSFETKYPAAKRGEAPVPIRSLNTQDISMRLDYLENEIRLRPDTFPLLPNTPRVSDVLTWISTHPTLTCLDGKEEGECHPFKIDTFQYSMVKRPELNKKNEKYQVKIDLEFDTSSPRLAREFHDALIAPNDFVDPKGEIKWNATKGKYRTSFYLKDKTAYP